MSTRPRRKQSVTSQKSAKLRTPAVDDQTNLSKPATPAKKTTRAKVAASKQKTKITVSPKTKRVPLKRVPKSKPVVIEEELDDAEWSSIEAESDVDSDAELEQLRKRLAELEADKNSRNPLKNKRAHTSVENTEIRASSSPERRGNPAEGRSLGTFNGKTDLDTFLVRLEACSNHFGWSKSEKVFHFDECTYRIRRTHC